MDFLQHIKTRFKPKITDYLPGQDSISARDMTFKITRWIEIPYIKPDLKYCATYNKANKSHLFVTVFARVSEAKKITAGTCTLIPANALQRHPAAETSSEIEHFNGKRCTSGFDHNYHRDIFGTLLSLYRDYAHPQTDLP